MDALGFTVTDVPVTAPIPLIVSVGEPVTVQLKVVDPPVATLAEPAVKLEIVGAVPTVIVTEAVTVPKALVALRT